MSLRESAAAAVRWTAASTSVVTGLQFVQLGVLAHILSPEDFGLMAMVLVILGFAQAYADMGISGAIIHRQDVTADQLSSLYWLNIATGVALYLAVILAAPLVVLVFNEPRLAELIHWAALVFLAVPLGQQFQVLLEKELRFSVLACVQTLAAIIGCVVAVLSALGGQGVYSLIAGQLSNRLSTALMLACIGWRQWRPRFHFKTADLKGYVGFGLYQMGERSINYLNSRLDQLLIGAFLGVQTLGYYNFAWNLVIQPMARINPVVGRVAFPTLAKVQSDTRRLKRGFVLMLRVLSHVNFPLLLGLVVVSPSLVPLLFGQQWVPAVILVQILAFVALIRSVGNPVGALLLAKGRADLGFVWNTILLAGQLFGVSIGLYVRGPIGVAVALLVLQVIYYFFGYAFLIRRLIDLSLRDYVTSIAPALALSLTMAVFVALIPFLTIGLPLAAVLVIQIVSGAAAYIGLNWLFRREHTLELTNLVLGKH